MNNIRTIPARNLLIALSLAGLLTAALSAPAAPAESIPFNGKDLGGWRKAGDWTVAKAVTLNSAQPEKFNLEPGEGILVNGVKGTAINLVTKAEFGDVEAHVEFCISKKSNSGVYLMGRYEVQIYDSHGVEKDKYPGLECGGLYPRWTAERNEFEGHSPKVNVSKPPGEWQSFDLVFRAPRFDASGKKIGNAKFVKVSHNGVVIHENVEVTGPTRAAMFEDEKLAGPLMLQGDHGPVAFRNIRIKTAEVK
jgi:hypothetical protein